MIFIIFKVYKLEFFVFYFTIILYIKYKNKKLFLININLFLNLFVLNL